MTDIKKNVLKEIKKTKLINVSNRLPIHLDKETIIKSSGGLVAAFEDIQHEIDFSWVGWSGTFTKNKKEQQDIETKLSGLNYIPVSLTKTEVEHYYNGFSNASLWPILHIFPSQYKFQHEWYQTYEDVNQKFATIIAENAPKDSIVWIHDYHFFLLPQQLKNSRPDLRIGFFLHTPFPSYDIFRIHPKCQKLLQGLLGADLIMFQTYNNLRHFRSAVLRILEIESDLFKLFNHPNQTIIDVGPIGISWKFFNKTLSSIPYKNALSSLKSTYKDKQLILSVERLDYTKGIPEKLSAIELFLTNYPELRDKVVFVQIAIPTRLNVPANQAIIRQVETQVSKINGKFGDMNNIPINFINHSISAEDLCALYHRADVCLVTPLMDGMNLVAKEYIACKEQTPGVLILSEFAGAAQELNRALIVNPYNAWKLSNTIYKALQTPKQESIEANNAMYQLVKEKNSTFWSLNFLNKLTSLKITQLKQTTKSDYDLILNKLLHAKKIAFVFDYDGTLRSIEQRPELASPTKEIYTLLQKLIQLPQSFVSIISGRSQEDLETWFGQYPLNLSAEHGFFIKKANDTWKHLNKEASFSWKPMIKTLMTDFSLSTPGSHVEEKKSSLVWHYRTCDPDYGKWKAQQLFQELSEAASNLPITIHQGSQKNVEASSHYVNKGMAMKKMLTDQDFDLIFCAGDDITDETMFNTTLDNLCSIKIGLNNSAANYKLESPEQLHQLLNSFLDHETT